MEVIFTRLYFDIANYNTRNLTIVCLDDIKISFYGNCIEYGYYPSCNMHFLIQYKDIFSEYLKWKLINE